MKLTEIYKNLILESTNTPLIIVDIQPAYERYLSIDIPNFISFLNDHRGKILILFNGEDLDLDSLYDIQSWYLDMGLKENKMQNIIWKEKMYGYFRDLMDSNIDNHLIIKCIREAVINKVNDSRDLSKEFIDVMNNKYDLDLNRYPFFIPDISIGLLHEFKNGYICGGSKSQCFREITLFLNALNIRIKEIKKFIY